MEQKKRKRIDVFLRLIRVFFVGVVVLWIFISFVRGLIMYGTVAPMELNTKEKVSYITGEFHVNNTNNIGSYTVSFNNGIMTLILNDVNDICELCFENLANYGITETDYHEIVDTDFDEHSQVRSKAALEEYDGTWPEKYHKGVDFETEIDSQHYYIIVYEEDSRLYCEVSKGWDYDVYGKLKSMN